MDGFPHAFASYVKSLAFIRLMVGGILRHCVLFTWALVDFTTKGHEMSSMFLLSLDFTSMLWLFDKEHERYTLHALNNISMPRLKPRFLLWTRHRIVSRPQVNLISLYVYTFGLEVFTIT